MVDSKWNIQTVQITNFEIGYGDEITKSSSFILYLTPTQISNVLLTKTRECWEYKNSRE